MNLPETLDLLRSAHDEILALRRERDELKPRAHAYDTIARLTRSTIPGDDRQGFSVDVAWQLRNAVERIEAEQRGKPEPGSPPMPPVAHPPAPEMP